MTQPTIYIGTSGWSYKHWRGTFYPDDIKEKKRFDYFSQQFGTVEINSSFYHMPPEKTFENWWNASPPGFVFSVKAGKYITHLKKLKDTKESTEYFIKNASALKEKLGPILFQLPPGWPVDLERLVAFLDDLPKGYRYAFELRNGTWYDESVHMQLKAHHAAF